MKFKLVLLAVLTMVLAACSTTAPRYYSRTPFWTDDVAASGKPGANTLTGSATFALSGNQMQPCGPIPVRLVPDSRYARQRFMELYGSDVSGAASGIGFNQYGPETGDYRWLDSGAQTSCANGNFSFQNVSDGTWYVVTTWVDSSNPKARSYSMFKRVVLAGGQPAQVTLP